MNLIEFILLAEPCRQASTPVVQRMNVAADAGGQRAHFAPGQHHRTLALSAGSGHDDIILNPTREASDDD